MSIESFAIWLSETPVSIALTDLPWAFPAIESLHVIALTAVLGSIALVDLRLVGFFARDRDARALIAGLLPITWAAFLLAAITGSFLFVANPVSYAANDFFRAKLILLALAGLNMLVFHRVAGRHLGANKALAPRLSGAISLALWIGIVIAGRLIGFTL